MISVCKNSAFSNFFKFASAAVLIGAIALVDFKDSINAAVKCGPFFKNNIDSHELYHPIMEDTPVVKNHPWMFVYIAGTEQQLRARGRGGRERERERERERVKERNGRVQALSTFLVSVALHGPTAPMCATFLWN